MADYTVISVDQKPDATVATVTATELDYGSSGQLRSEVVAAASASSDLPMILDMTRVTFVPSVALGALITLTRLFKEGGQRFVLVGVHPDVRDTLSVCHLDKLFEMHESADEAIRNMT